MYTWIRSRVLIVFCEPPEFVREERLLAAQGGSITALKEEDSSHPLLRGAENTTEGFEVHRANILQVLLP